MKCIKCVKIFVTLLFALFVFNSLQGQVVIEMEKDGGVYKVPCKVNGLKLKFIFDTGASNVCLSGAVADMMLENGYLDKSDIVGSGKSSVADGRIVDHTVINIKEVEIGGLILRDVEAVVIHQQSAPLLLGQSAIQRLGQVLIQDNKLVINQYGNSVASRKSNYTNDEIAEFFELARNADNDSAYELAAEYLGILYENQELSTYGKYRYATCLRAIDKCYDALSVYKEVINDINSLDFDDQLRCYFGMQVCCNDVGDYNSAIQYGQIVLSKAKLASDIRKSIVRCLACSYKDMGNQYSAFRTVEKEIDNYLSYMEIKATDCWDKLYKDKYLAELYYYANLFSKDTQKMEKYIIIAAAWGNEESIEILNRYGIDYSNKPWNYVY